jgi:DnaJ-class molecular chaperone
MLTVPKGSSSGKVLRLSGRGFHKKGGGPPVARGNLLVTLIIDLPADDAALAAFVEEWRDERNPRSGMGV